ncbi:MULTISPECIES: hypothetical protein [Myxococcus]|nr:MULTISPECIES: hypothetical protein [Myxococcus]NOJ52409.1 hypothetical protein [Myxococcus xanthus]QPM78722.1 hypothetical protein I5Q59_31440 [Myxococcus xanthus]QVW67792.1 hypothetical protein JTM82_36790 [Myxococcus xanthus DZ2]UEO06086.1 hypothetical protein K1515_06005 [Myxococcus xanthus DZ2]UYI13654.1 hypothetical protein N3T43_32095 [Myxococcus xanthus]
MAMHSCGSSSDTDSSDEFQPWVESDDEDWALVREEKRPRKRQKKPTPKAQNPKEKEKEASSDNEDEDEDEASSDNEDEDEGGPAPLRGPSPDFEYYSSDDDETPLGPIETSNQGTYTARKEFEATVAFLRAVQDLFENLSNHYQVCQATAELLKIPQGPIHQFTEKALFHTIKNKQKIAGQNRGYEFRISTPAQWMALAKLLRNAQYRPCDIIVELWPKAARNRMCIRGGNSLISPYTGMARTWPSLALELHQTALMLGLEVCARVLKQEVRPKGIERIGHQLLAAIMLRAYRGQGAEVFDFLVGNLGLGSKDMERLEEFISEFFALSFGVESERLFLTHLETLLHLENIANGFKFSLNPKIRCSRGGTPGVVGQHLFNFLNVFSGIREIGGENQHVYIPARLEKTPHGKEKDVAKYQGFVLEKEIQQALRFKDMHGRGKSKRSRGKSMVAGGAGFFHLKPFLGGQNKKGNPYRDFTTRTVIEGVWNQLRPVAPEEDRGQLHADRLEFMACIRIYNTLANFLRRSTQSITRGYWDQRFRFYGGNTRMDAEWLVGWISSLLLGRRSYDYVSTIWSQSLPMLGSTLAFPDVVQQLVERAFPQLMGGKRLTLDPSHTYQRHGFCSGMRVLEAEQLMRTLLSAGWVLQERKYGDEWLGNEHMEELFLHHLAEASPSFAQVPPVDVNAVWWEMTAAIVDSLAEQSASPQGVSPFLVCPINLGNRHWACFVIELNLADLSSPTVYFFDSLGSNAQKLAVVRRIIEDTQLLSSPTLVDLSAAVQTDGHTCGTWMLEAARLILQLRLSGVDLADIGTFHAELLALQEQIGDLHAQNVQFQEDYAAEDSIDEDSHDTTGKASMGASKNSDVELMSEEVDPFAEGEVDPFAEGEVDPFAEGEIDPFAEEVEGMSEDDSSA